MIELRDIGFRYDQREVLRHVDLTLDEGELVLVAGRTGVGKSTLLGLVTGLVPRFTGGVLTGEVLLDGTSIVAQPPRDVGPHQIVEQQQTKAGRRPKRRGGGTVGSPTGGRQHLHKRRERHVWR